MGQSGPCKGTAVPGGLVPATAAFTWLLYRVRSHYKKVKRRKNQPVLLNIEGVLSPNGLFKVIYPIFKYKGKKNYSVLLHPDLCLGIFAVGRCWLQQL